MLRSNVVSVDKDEAKRQLKPAQNALHAAFFKYKSAREDPLTTPEQREADYRAAFRAHEHYRVLREPLEAAYKADLSAASIGEAEAAAFDAYSVFKAQFPDPGPPQEP